MKEAKYTAEEAIDNSIRKWTVLAESDEYRKWIKDITTTDMPHGCALCQFAGQPEYHRNGISRYRCRKCCPYAQRFGCCCNQRSPFKKWEDIRSGDNPERVELRKNYASEFLCQLRQLKNEVVNPELLATK